MAQEQERITKFCRDLQSIEIRTMRYLGIAYVVTRTPELRVMVPMSTFNYEIGKDVGFALQILFTLPPNYPFKKPHVQMVEKHNLPLGLELTMLADIEETLDQHVGLQMIAPVVTRVQMLMNNAMLHLQLRA